MSALGELERRLRDEPENLGLRVVVAGALREAGRHADAIELYRSVAIAYRDQGRLQQAIAVCRSILEIAPDDELSRALLATLEPPPRRSSFDQTPLPGPLPYHVADPTTRSLKKISAPVLPLAPPPPEGEGEAEDVTAELDTRQRPRIPPADLAKIAQRPPTAPPLLPQGTDARDGVPTETDTEEELTVPRELPPPRDKP